MWCQRRSSSYSVKLCQAIEPRPGTGFVKHSVDTPIFQFLNPTTPLFQGPHILAYSTFFPLLLSTHCRGVVCQKQNCKWVISTTNKIVVYYKWICSLLRSTTPGNKMKSHASVEFELSIWQLSMTHSSSIGTVRNCHIPLGTNCTFCWWVLMSMVVCSGIIGSVISIFQ